MSTPDEATPADETTTASESQSAEATLADLEQQLAAANDARLRTLAEFQNYRRRTDEERDSLKSFLLTGVMESLLPIVDNF